jgi:hypothetical protein
MPFELGENMSFDEEKMAKDIDEYGLYNYEDFEDYISFELFEALNAKYLKVLVGKGLVALEDCLALFKSEGVVD